MRTFRLVAPCESSLAEEAAESRRGRCEAAGRAGEQREEERRGGVDAHRIILWVLRRYKQETAMRHESAMRRSEIQSQLSSFKWPGFFTFDCG